MSTTRIAAVALLAVAAASAQAVPELSTTHQVNIDSGLVANTSTSPAAKGFPQVVWSTVVTVQDAAWVRLQYDGVLLSGRRDPGGDGSFLRLTSLFDGAVQTQHLRHVAEWRDTSAYFNGNAVLVELLAYPGTGDNRIVLRSATAGPVDPINPDSICGPTDDRQLSNDGRVARNQPTGCTSWMINDCNHCFLTAGHCTGNLQVVQFNVPLSTPSGQIQHPPPSDQYAVDASSMQSNGGQGVGNDYAYFGVFDNSTTGLSPYQANGGQAFDLLPSPPPVSGQNIRITGNGSTSSPVPPQWYLVQKTHAGPYFSFTGTTVRYTADTTGGNSGSPVILDGTNQAIGIHTHGGCSSTGGSNAGTGSNNAGLQSVLANPQGVCDCPALEFSFPNGLPGFVLPNGTSTIEVAIGGQLGVVASSVRFHVSTGGPFQVLTPTQSGPSTFTATVPPSVCGAQVRFWFSAQGTDLQTYTSPENAPASMHMAPSAEQANTIRDYDFQTNPPGWSVVNTSLATGAWVRAVPFDSRGPSSDFDGSGACWVTGNANLEDVDGGPTRLVTETVDLSSASDPTITYAVWFENDDGDDFLTIEISNNGGAGWVTVETLGTTPGWLPRTLRVRDVFPNPNQVAMRFSTQDQPNNSVTEAAMDAFKITDLVCTPASFTTLGSGCTSGASAPALQLVSLPTIGGTLQLQVTGLGAGVPVMFAGLGSPAVGLPAPPFAPGCVLYTTPDVFEVLTAVAGVAPWSLPIPNDPTLAGTLVYEQAVEFGGAWTASAGGVAEIR